MAGNQIHNLDVPILHTAVSGTASGNLTLLSAIGADWGFRVLGITVANDAANANTISFKDGAAGSVQLVFAVPANDSKDKDYSGKVWEVADNTDFVARLDETPTAPGQVLISVDYYKRFLK